MSTAKRLKTMETKKIKLAAPVKVEPQSKTIAIKGTLYVQPNGDQFFEAVDNNPKEIKRSNGYKLIYSNGVVKHYTTQRRHVIFLSLSKDVTAPLGSVLPRAIVKFCAECSTKGIKYYVRKEATDD